MMHTAHGQDGFNQPPTFDIGHSSLLSVYSRKLINSLERMCLCEVHNFRLSMSTDRLVLSEAATRFLRMTIEDVLLFTSLR